MNTPSITGNTGPVTVGNENNVIMISITENKNNQNCRELKSKIFHSKGKQIIIQLREPPKNEEIKEEIPHETGTLISNLEKWLFQDKRLSLVCIDNNEKLTYSFI